MSNTGSGLDIATITALLNEEKAAQGGKLPSQSKDATVSKFLKPIQIGPLRYHETIGRCASRGCGSQTLLKVNGIYYCATHALYELNRLLLTAEKFDYADCSCKAGMHSKMNVHTSDCPVWTRVKEQSDNSGSSRESAASTTSAATTST